MDAVVDEAEDEEEGVVVDEVDLLWLESLEKSRSPPPIWMMRIRSWLELSL